MNKFLKLIFILIFVILGKMSLRAVSEGSFEKLPQDVIKSEKEIVQELKAKTIAEDMTQKPEFAENKITQENKMKNNLLKSDFEEGGSIPKKFTCEGKNISPKLNWEDWNISENTKSFVLIVHDPDAPDPKAPEKDWVHWVVYNIPVTIKKLSENISSDEIKKIGALEGKNDFKKTTYGGPCPPIGEHRYYFDIYALSDTIKNDPTLNQASLDQVKNFEKFIKDQGIYLGKISLMGKYDKKK